MQSEQQDKSFELRYTRNADFTDRVAEEFLARNLSAEDVARMLSSAKAPRLLRPFVG